MKIKVASFFLLFFIFFGFIVVIPSAFAGNSEITITPTAGASAPGCEETAEGCYIPGTVTVDVGGVVIFSNTDSAAHTFTSGDPTMPDTVQVLFDSGLVLAGSTFKWSPTETGEISYFCMVHPWMKGLLIVEGEIETFDNTISDNSTGGDCGTLGGIWNDGTNTCTFASLVVYIDFEDSLTVDENVTVMFQGGADEFELIGSLSNDGTINNNGSMKFVGGAGSVSGNIYNDGTINNNGSMKFVGGNGYQSGSIAQASIINNNGSMKFVGGAGEESGVIFNYTINNDGTINNSSSTINNNGSMEFVKGQVNLVENLTTSAPSTTFVREQLLEQFLGMKYYKNLHAFQSQHFAVNQSQHMTL